MVNFENNELNIYEKYQTLFGKCIHLHNLYFTCSDEERERDW